MRLFRSTLTAVAAGAVLAACTGSPGSDATPTPTPPETPPPTATARTSPSASPTESPSATGGPLGDADECENEELGYEVEYPGDWWANERIEPEDEDLTPIPACQYFAFEPIDLRPNAGFPPGLSIWFERVERSSQPPESVITEDETTVDGYAARIYELEPAPQEGFIPEGSRIYMYVIDLDEEELYVRTSDIHQDTRRYETSKSILDAMMDTLDLDDD